MRLDIHIHTTHSDCSSLDINVICAKATQDQSPLVTVTDHGNARACLDLKARCQSATVVFGVEVTTREGDFLVYSLDAEYVTKLSVYQKTVRDLRRDSATAVIWAHPRVPHKKSIGWTSPGDHDGLIEGVIHHIDGLELFNGSMLGLAASGMVQRTYFSNLLGIATRENLTITGGSDAHDSAHFFTAWTEFGEDVKHPEDFIQALKKAAVKPGYDHNFYKINVP